MPASRRGQNLPPDFPVVTGCHTSSLPGAQTQPSLWKSGTFWLGHLDSLRLRFFGRNRELLTNTVLYTHTFGTTAHTRHLICCCQMEKVEGGEEELRLAHLGKGL